MSSKNSQFLSSLILSLFALPSTLLFFYNFINEGLNPTFYMAFRYYDPQRAQFSQPDTINPNPTNPQGFNRYIYVNNNPLKFTDPTGHVPHDNSQKETADTATNAYVLDFASNNGRYHDLVENSLNQLVSKVGTISLGEPTYNHLADMSSLQHLISTEVSPSEIVARRIHMQPNPNAPDSIQAYMFGLLKKAFTGERVYIQSSRFLTDEDYTRRYPAQDIPYNAYDLDINVDGFRYGSLLLEDNYHYIYVPNIAGSTNVGANGTEVKYNLAINLGHEIAHSYIHKAANQRLTSLFDSQNPSPVSRLLLTTAMESFYDHPKDPFFEKYRRQKEIGDFTLLIENTIVRPSMNATVGYKYEKREYYYEETHLIKETIIQILR